ncbi:ImmA/IrrE family metallo-endopeptidase [Marinobacterium sp. D7]|uniref:ImmA/IrrE family metallo-endopeptidase n=1 Tax=Marinobacterium ramblicola TaxID=2849041 RepID=UPI001C2D5099|nr:ImmA/IrrE family metallo-endopeptidase [Marinobacterium ramblicola]MBV1788403.1 ImmA/IrrE family metallo-endopeptidase [Marinobacterium ramblicola]
MPHSVARELIDRYWDYSLPVNPARIAERMGIQVVTESDSSISGKAEITPDGAFISFNPNDAEVRRRFTLAHELGHLALNHVTPSSPCLRDPSQNFSLSNYDAKESEANRFAAELLMPAKAIEILIEKRDITDFSELARQFNVSLLAMEYRLKNLGWIR